MASLVRRLQVVIFVGGKAQLLTLRRPGFGAETKKPLLPGVSVTEAEAFDAFVSSFGSLGVVYSITLVCQKSYKLMVSRVRMSLKELSERPGYLAEVSKKYYSVNVQALAPDTLIIKTQTLVEGELLPPTSPTDNFGVYLHLFVKHCAMSLSVHSGTFYNLLRPYFLHLLAKAKMDTNVYLCDWVTAEVDAALHVAVAARPWVNVEYAVPLERAEDVMKLMVKLIAKYGEGQAVLRPVNRDDCGLLSPARGRETLFVDVPYYASRDLYCRDMEQGLLALGGRPSWGRVFFASREQVVKAVPELPEFIRIKKQLDPENIFSNAFSDYILFGPSADNPFIERTTDAVFAPPAESL